MSTITWNPWKHAILQGLHAGIWQLAYKHIIIWVKTVRVNAWSSDIIFCLYLSDFSLLPKLTRKSVVALIWPEIRKRISHIEMIIFVITCFTEVWRWLILNIDYRGHLNLMAVNVTDQSLARQLEVRNINLHIVHTITWSAVHEYEWNSLTLDQIVILDCTTTFYEEKIYNTMKCYNTMSFTLSSVTVSGQYK